MIFMSWSDALSWLSTNLFAPLFGFTLSFAGGVTFGAVVVALFGLPLVVKAYKKFF